MAKHSEPISFTGEIAYDGPMPPNRWAGIPQGARTTSFIYVLFGYEGALYVGKAMTPSQRFDRHTKKPWWPLVTHVRIYRLTASDRVTASRMALDAESRAIRAFDPIFNVSRPILRDEVAL